MRTRHLVTAALTTAAVLPAALAVTLAGAGPAAAASWTGQTATGTVCANDARTVASARLQYDGRSGNATISLRYSPGCRTAWAHISGASAPRAGDSAGGAAAIHRSDGVRYLCTAGADGGCSTAMVVDAGFTAYANGTDDTGFAIYQARTSSY